MSREWRRIQDQWENARIGDAQFISLSEAIGAHYGALTREMIRRDFGQAWRLLPASTFVMPLSITRRRGRARGQPMSALGH
jgi:hypothetical protein